MWRSIGQLEPLRPNFVSVTYGANGSDAERSHATVERLVGDTSMTTAAHVTCVGQPRATVDGVIRRYWEAGVRHIVALRGDPAGGVGNRYEPHPDGYRNAADLVAGIKRMYDAEISVSAYPEKHPESPTVDADLDMLAAKVDAGASRAITQFFFDNDHYFRYVDRVRARGIDVPIVPGIMTVQNFEQTSSFAAKCGTSIPARLAARFAGLEHDPHTRQLVAANVATEQVLGLVDAGVTDLHFYTMNRAELVYSICRLLDVHPIADPVTARGGAGMSISALRQAASERILVLDGAMGTMIQGLGFDEDAYRGAQFDAWNRAVHGNNDLLNITQPDAIRSIHYALLPRRCRHRVDQHVLVDRDRPGRLRHERARLRPQPGRRRARPRGRPDGRTRGRPAALRRRRRRPDEPHGVDLARRVGPRLPGRDVRRAGRGLHRAGPRACSTVRSTCC